MRNYLSNNRKLLYQTRDGLRQIAVTSGAAQGSILGPDLWNMCYDAIPKLDAADITVVIIARDTEETRKKLKQVRIRTQAILVGNIPIDILPYESRKL